MFLMSLEYNSNHFRQKTLTKKDNLKNKTLMGQRIIFGALFKLGVTSPSPAPLRIMTPLSWFPLVGWTSEI